MNARPLVVLLTLLRDALIGISKGKYDVDMPMVLYSKYKAAGMCNVISGLYEIGEINDDECIILNDYLSSHKPLIAKKRFSNAHLLQNEIVDCNGCGAHRYWFTPSFLPPRIKWLNSQLKLKRVLNHKYN